MSRRGDSRRPAGPRVARPDEVQPSAFWRAIPHSIRREQVAIDCVLAFGGANGRNKVAHLALGPDTRRYLTPHSDIAGLMVLEHQVGMQNLLTRAGYEARSILYQQQTLNRSLGRPERELSEQSSRRLDDAADAVLRYLLMTDEEFLEDPLVGTSGFAEHFSAAGGESGRGASLRKLNLRRTLLDEPCSYMIYSPSFDALPPVLKDRIYRRLYAILTSQDTAPAWATLSTAARQRLLQTLRQIKPDLPDYFSNDWLPQTSLNEAQSDS